jgi:hypothetical protein
VDEVHQLGGVMTGEAGHLGDRDTDRGFCLASLGGVTGDPTALD